MNRTHGVRRFLFLFLGAILVLTACGGNQTLVEPTNAPTSTAMAQVELPVIHSVEADRNEVPRYESLELMKSRWNAGKARCVLSTCRTSPQIWHSRSFVIDQRLPHSP
jgi:hypothetical protein